MSLSTIRVIPVSEAAPADGIEPMSVRQLSDSESLLLSAIRAWISASCRWATVQTEFRSTLGKNEGAASLIALQALLIFVAANARRRLRIGFVGCPVVSSDELAVLQLLAAAQACAFGQLRPRLRWLVTGVAAVHADALVRECAGHLTASSVALPLRRQTPSP